MSHPHPLPWRTTLLTLFPEVFPGTLGVSLPGRTLKEGLWSLDTVNLRDFGIGSHAMVDETPYGGGAGMVMRPDVGAAAIDHARSKNPEAPLFYLSPRGKLFTQSKAYELVQNPGLILLCGRFEGVDQRLLDVYEIEELSIGDYVLYGGEVAAQVVLEACVRLLKGAIGTEASLAEESFSQGSMERLLEYPHYTRPAVWQGCEVPAVLTSGHHGAIQAWRRAQAEALTQLRRPDLYTPLKPNLKI